MTKSKLVHEFRIYLYADGTSAYRVLEHTEPKRDANGRFASRHAAAKPRTIFCPACGTKIVL